jgi:hypothetical protein
MTAEAREQFLIEVNAAFSDPNLLMSEGRPHKRAKSRAADMLGLHFKQSGRVVYVAEDMSVVYAGPCLLKSVNAQPRSVQAGPVEWTVAVGEPFTVRVRVRAAAGAVIRFPVVPDSAGSVEAVDPRAIEDRSTSTVFDQTATYRFIAWEPGRRDVPLGDVRWEHGRTVDTLAVGRLRVEVTTLLPADTAEQVLAGARARSPRGGAGAAAGGWPSC